MANLTKLKRDEMIAFLEELKQSHSDDESIRAFNEIENTLTDKKFGLVFEEHTEEVDERLLNEIPIFCADETRKICKDKDLPYNFIIEGDNLQALYLLEKTHRGKVDCIYIDPPYNTGTDFIYPDSFIMDCDEYEAGTGYFNEEGNVNYSRENGIGQGRYHSDWCSLMYSRLMLARNLLSEEGILFASIDDNELYNLIKIGQDVFIHFCDKL